jgi:PAS domain S-box-containing protein
MEESTANPARLETQLFYDAFKSSPIGIAVENLEGQPLFVNPALCSMLGFSEEEMCSKHCVECSPPEDAKKDWALFEELRAGSIDHYQIEKRFFRRDGSLMWGRLSISLLNSPSPLVLAMVEDITEKKRAEETRLRHAAVIESSDDAIASGTLDGIIVSWNAGAQKIYGYTEAEAVGKSITMLLPPELSDEENKILDTLRAGGRIEHFETVRVTKTGKRINVSLTISPVIDSSGRITGISGIARDITDRKSTEEALRASEERLRLAQQAARIGTFEWNIQTGVNTWTPELEEMYGLPLGGFGGTQAAFENLVCPDDRAGLIELVNVAMKGGQPTQGEWRVVWPDGSVHWIAGRWQVFMNESGEPSRMIGVNIDITERKQVEQELAKANERLHLAIESGSAGGWDYDLKTGKSVWFGKAHEQLGMIPDESSGSRKEFWDRVHEDDRERVEHALQIAQEKRQDFAEDVRVVWRDGTTHWLRSRGRFQYAANGEAERSLGISLDVTERKQVEDRLREYERAVEAAEEMIAVLDREYRILIANRKYATMRNMQKEQIVGRFAREVLNKGVFEGVVKPKLDECFQGKVVRYEMKYTYPELGERDLSLSYFPIEGATRVEGAVCIALDITDRKRLEEALTGVSRKLIDAQEHERARIARELHDDINQRLALLGIELEQLQDNPSEVGSRVQEVRKKMSKISSDVQALSHDLHSSQLEYLGVVAGMKSWCKEFGERQRMKIDFRSSEAPHSVPSEIGLCLFRVLQEALHNAAKHSGVKRVEVQLREDSGEIQMVVSDLGRGFDVEAEMKGKGLGLTSMRERVRLVNGTIRFNSKPMGGTTIHVRVPLGVGETF